jgi:hypothetical protein
MTPRFVLILCLLTACDPDVVVGEPCSDGGTGGGGGSMGGGNGATGGGSGSDGGTDPFVGFWTVSGLVTTEGGSRSIARFTAMVSQSSATEYLLEAGGCRLPMVPDNGVLRSRPGATATCPSSFLTLEFENGGALTIDSMRPIRIDLGDARLTVGSGTCTLAGNGRAGYADMSLTQIDFAYTCVR